MMGGVVHEPGEGFREWRVESDKREKRWQGVESVTGGVEVDEGVARGEREGGKTRKRTEERYTG